MKILLIRLSALGDLVIMTSALEYLKDKGEVTVLTNERYFPLFKDDPRVSNLVDFHDFRSIINERFDLACDLHGKPKTIVKLILTKAASKCIIDKRVMERRLAVWFKKKIREVPLYRLYVKPLQRFFDDKSFPIPSLKIRFDKPSDLPKRYIAVFPGASQPQKMWPLKYFLDVSEAVYEKYGIKSVYLGAENIRIPQEIYIVNRMGVKPLTYVVNTAKYALFVISNDSGPAHIAGAVGTPLFVMFGPTIPEFGFRPVSSAPVFLFERKDLMCRPCSLHGEKRCRFGDLRCLSGISPLTVLEKIDLFLKNSV